MSLKGMESFLTEILGPLFSILDFPLSFLPAQMVEQS